MLGRSFVVLVTLSLAACGQRSAHDREDETTGRGAARVRAEPGLVTGVVVRGERAGAGEIAPVVEARGDAPVRVKRSVAVERREGDRWTAVAVRDLTLRPDCEHDASECITLVRGAGLRPPAWNGKSGDGQCACRSCADAPAGVYRFVLEACEGGNRVSGEPFALTR